MRRKRRPVFSPANRVLAWHAFSIALALSVYLFLGPLSLALLLFQAVIAILVFAAVDYLEHYGLTRAIGPDGKPERMTARHSWNSSHMLTNVGLFNAGRHADHHLTPAKPYHRLLHRPDAPQLPYGYSAMIALALVPPLWFRVMDRELARIQERPAA